MCVFLGPLVAVSTGGGLISGAELGDPNAGEWYRLRRVLPVSCHLNVRFRFLDNAFFGGFGVVAEVGELENEEAVGNSKPIVGEPDGMDFLKGGMAVGRHLEVAEREI